MAAHTLRNTDKDTLEKLRAIVTSDNFKTTEALRIQAAAMVTLTETLDAFRCEQMDANARIAETTTRISKNLLVVLGFAVVEHPRIVAACVFAAFVLVNLWFAADFDNRMISWFQGDDIFGVFTP